MKASCLIVLSSSFLRVIISAIGHVLPHESNTKETRRCPIVLGRQQDYVKPSHCRHVAIESRKFTARGHGVDEDSRP